METSDIFLLGQIVVFGAVLPTVDTFSDLILSGKLFQSEHPLWAIAILLPVLINFFFIVIAFRQFPFPPWHHRYISVTMLILQVEPQFYYLLLISYLFSQVWPQYLSLSTAHGFLVGNPDWKKKRAYYMLCSYYHPDKIDASQHGMKYKVLCEEISKRVNERFG